MWAPLQHPGHLELYRELEHACYLTEDWQPMIRAIEYLQAQPYASELFAFSSLANFHVTTAPCYQDFSRHGVVSITWSVDRKQFSLALGKPRSHRRESGRTCEERDFPTSVDSLIQGLLIKVEDNRSAVARRSDK
jgi:hypothetical protein